MIRAIWQYVETKFHEFRRSFNKTEGVRLQVNLISHDLELYQVCLKELARHTRCLDSLMGAETPGGVREKRSFGFAQ